MNTNLLPSGHLMNNFGTRALSMVRGSGCYLYDNQGREYLDAIAGIAVCGLGHSHPAITAALSEQASTLVHCSNLFNIHWQEKLADKLAGLSGLERAFFCNSGTEANEAAIKLCRLYGHAKNIDCPEVIVCEGAFHGRTLGALSATHGKKLRAGFEPLLNGFVRVPYGDAAAVEAASSDATVAVMVEPIQGEAGIVLPGADYLRDLRALCDRRGWLLVLDEIQTGNGRTGEYFACSHSQTLPDILTTAKGLGNGFPIGVCLTTSEVASLFTPGSHGTTFGGSPLASRIGCEVVDQISANNLSQRAGSLGKKLLANLQRELSPLASVCDVRGSGLMLAIEMHEPCAEIVGMAAQLGLVVNVTNGNRVRLLPPLVLTDAQADQIVNILATVITQREAQK